jgi:hypothetical protein
LFCSLGGWSLKPNAGVLREQEIGAAVFGRPERVFNHPNFATPNSTISDTSTVCTIASIRGSTAAEVRIVEFGAKFMLQVSGE